MEGSEQKYIVLTLRRNKQLYAGRISGFDI
jgi:hypothetical protein